MHRDENRSAAPWFSPGLVRDDEVVVRTVLDPDHFKGNKLASVAIPLKDIQSRGWSVDRKSFTSSWYIRFSHWQWQRRRLREGREEIKRFYVLPIPVRLLRDLDPHTGNQEFVVTDAALCMNPAHAHVLLARELGDAIARGLRTNLLQRLPPYVDVSNAFGPADRGGLLRGMFGKYLAIVRRLFRSVLN